MNYKYLATLKSEGVIVSIWLNVDLDLKDLKSS